MATPVWFLFFLLLERAVSFSTLEATETIGGLVTNNRVCLDRIRVDTEASQQSDSIYTSSSTATEAYWFNFTCFTRNLTFFQDSMEPYFLNCNLTGYTTTPLSISFDTDIPALAKLDPPFWVYQDVGNVFRTFNISILRRRMGSAYLNIWIRKASVGGDTTLIHPFDKTNHTQVEKYTQWLVDGKAIYENESDPISLGIHLKILRARGVIETVFRIFVAVMVCGLTLVMGCELDVRLIWHHLKRPISPLIGFLCQYGLMPTVSSLSMRKSQFTT
ncbi:unnamed protein product [Hymenolepis diminuta]|uniref:Uncharacterized protein n=1 Tax=Hymenolepis diminuta TaxID=6216 RepID=A0A564YUS9_HYMDI|nr:unnamed protein product [Hymenolepis diminuta]VUZ50448.1 unnamed protein product [Hymenolepis diminuta]